MGQKVLNITRNTTVATDVRVADNYFKRLQGLMGKARMQPDSGLWIVPCNDIHSFFMRFEFDAIFLNRENTVLYLLERMKPWRISRFVKGGRAVLELPAGTIKASATEIGDQLSLQTN